MATQNLKSFTLSTWHDGIWKFQVFNIQRYTKWPRQSQSNKKFLYTADLRTKEGRNLSGEIYHLETKANNLQEFKKYVERQVTSIAREISSP